MPETLRKRFSKPFTQQEPLPEDAIAAAVAVMQSGRLHRYNVVDGELGETALLEQEFAALERNDAIEEELKALKKKRAKPAAPKAAKPAPAAKKEA